MEPPNGNPKADPAKLPYLIRFSEAPTVPPMSPLTRLVVSARSSFLICAVISLKVHSVEDLRTTDSIGTACAESRLSPDFIRSSGSDSGQ